MANHTGVTFQVKVPDFGRGVEFYTKLLKRKPDFILHGSFAEWEIVPNAWLQVGEGEPAMEPPIRLGVEDIRKEKDRIVSELGVEVSEIGDVNDSGDIAYWCDFRDPFGNKLGLFQDLSRTRRSIYASVYIYRVPSKKVDAFLLVQKEAAAIYRSHGAIDDETFAPLDLKAKYGCASFADTLRLKEDEVVFIGMSLFRDGAHHDEVMAKVDADKRTNVLYRRITELFDIQRITRGEFKREI
ncbi:MAG: DUF1428 family protein [Candidatus Bathyarchaeia archaeon]